MPRAAISRARALRRRSTEAERRLWSHLRNGKLYGFKFRRQHPIGERVVDFFCVEAQLAIELDGSGHGFPGKQKRDLVRTREIAEGGIRIIRFWNSAVRENLGDVVDAILFELDPQLSRWANDEHFPSPGALRASSSPRGRGHR